MKTNQALALKDLEERLRNELQHNVPDIMDHLESDHNLLQHTSYEFAKITHRMLTGHEQISLLIGYFLTLSGQKGKKVFAMFCNVLRQINFEQLAKELESKEEMYDQGTLSSQSSGDMEFHGWECKRSAPFLPETFPSPSTGLQQAATNAAPASVQKSQTTTQQQQQPQADVEPLLAHYRKRLLQLCRIESKRTALPGIGTRREGQTDVRSFYTSVQALTLEQAEQQLNEKGGKTERCSMTTRSIPIRRASQLLQRKLGEHVPSHYDNDRRSLVESSMLVSPAGSGKSTVCKMLLSDHYHNNTDSSSSSSAVPSCSAVDSGTCTSATDPDSTCQANTTTSKDVTATNSGNASTMTGSLSTSSNTNSSSTDTITSSSSTSSSVDTITSSTTSSSTDTFTSSTTSSPTTTTSSSTDTITSSSTTSSSSSSCVSSNENSAKGKIDDGKSSGSRDGANIEKTRGSSTESSGGRSRRQHAEKEMEFRRDAVLSNFNYVVHLPCRDVDRVCSYNWSTLLGLDEQCLHLDTHQQDQMIEYLEDQSQQVLFIVDGLDEIGKDVLEERSALSALVHRERFADSRILLTSRPCQLASTLAKECEEHYWLAGFNDHQLERYCLRNLGEDLGQSCWDELCEVSLGHVKEALKSSPLLCAMLCELYRSRQNVPRCATMMYSGFVKQAANLRGWQLQADGVSLESLTLSNSLARATTTEEDEEEHSAPLWTTRSSQPHHCVPASTDTAHTAAVSGDTVLIQRSSDTEQSHQCMSKRAQNELGRVALMCLNRKQVLIPKSALSSECINAACSIGLLVESNTGIGNVPHSQAKPCVYFVHYSLQEYFAAQYLCADPEHAQAVRECARDGYGVGEETAPFWAFVCGSATSKQLAEIISILKSAMLEHGRTVTNATRSLLSYFMEHVNTRPTLAEQAMLGSATSEETSYLSKAVDSIAADGLRLDNVRLGMSDVLALQCVHDHATTIKLLDLSNCNLTAETCNILTLSKAEELQLGVNPCSASLVEMAARSLSCPGSKVRNLGLETCDLSACTYPALLACVQAKNLQGLRLLNNKELGNGFLEYLQQTLYSECQLTYLDLQNVGLTVGCGSQLAALITKLPQLQRLDMSCNNLSNSDMEQVLAALNTNVVEVVWVNDLDDAIVPAIREFYQRKNGKQQQRHSSTSTSQAVQNGHTCDVQLQGCNVTREGLETIATAQCLSRGDLVFTGLHFVNSDGVGERDLRQKLLKSRANLYMQYIGDTGAQQIAPAIGYNGRDHYMYYIAHQTIQKVIPVMAVNTTMEILDLRYCNITNTGAEVLAEQGLAHNNTLRVVDLSHNNIGLRGLCSVLRACRQRTPSSPLALVMSDNNIFPTYEQLPALQQPQQQQQVDVIRPVTSLLSQCTGIVCLALPGTGLDDDPGAEFITCLRSNQSIKWLTLGRNALSDRSAGALCVAMETNTTLKTIALYKNNVTDDGVKQLISSPGVQRMHAVALGDNPCHTEQFRMPLFDGSISYTPSSLLELTKRPD
ncbi:uncharacterized protein LOC135819502 [Sycon ciliatum]|uniref:uncharacterized protein LOC135819502 n=1 Tax=Sycon ciliatum TaxID=27933 RepID=UPI0031F693CE